MIGKTEPVGAIVGGIRAAARGDVVAGAAWAAALEGDRRLVDARLTPRETEVLALYAAGATADQVDPSTARWMPRARTGRNPTRSRPVSPRPNSSLWGVESIVPAAPSRPM